MIKKILSLAFVAVSALFASAQTPLPLNPAVKHGTLPNGLNYYILHNEEPKERVNFYIAQKVGSTLESPEQLGLAHFLEHMAFNGTEHYPGKNMLNYLQSKGIRFGSDINAYTSFDETVYRIENVPTTDKALVDSVLLVFHDWSGSLLLEEDEINSERGVIEEEWRSRNDARSRMLEAILPQIYKEYQYQQTPIGKIEIIRTFPPQVLRDYYKKWYRPDQQGIVIVGDIDAAEMEQKVIDLFSKIPMPANAAERVYPTVSDNSDPIVAHYVDKETQFPTIFISFKSEKTPFEMRNTMENYLATNIFEILTAEMINNRLDEYSKKPEAKYVYAGVSFGDFFVSKTKAAFDVTIIAKSDPVEAINDAMAVVAQACKTGFMQSELVRARDELLSNYEKAYNERNNTTSKSLANELCRHFIDNEPAPGIETEYQLAKQILPMLPVEAFNESVSQILTPENEVIVISEPAKDEMVEISNESVVTALRNAINAEYEAYQDEVITDPLIEKLNAPGKIAKQEAGPFETTVFTLSNGAKVMVKPTDFKKDEILFTAVKNGGKVSYAESQAADVLLSDDAFNYSKLGAFDEVKLQKYLAGKKSSIDFSIGTTSTLLNGSSTVKDLPTLMELIYSSFTQLNPDPAAFQNEMDNAKKLLANEDKDIMRVFQKLIAKYTYNSNPMFQSVGLSTIEAANYDKSFAIVKEALSNPADYTFIFTGSVNNDSIKPLLEKYIASIPAGKANVSAKQLTSAALASGQINELTKFPMAVPMTAIYLNDNDNNIPYSIENSVKIDMLGDILSNIYTETLREEEGGAYSPYASGNFNAWNGYWQIISIVQTNADVQNKMIDRAKAEFAKLLKDGATESQFGKVKEAAMKQYEINVRTNRYWDNSLFRYVRGIDDITNHKAAIENLTLADFNKFISTLYNGKNHIQLVIEGVADK